MGKIPLIYDGDMGGDDLWAITVLLAHLDRFDLLGFATCFGNVNQPFVTQNLLNHLHWLGLTDAFEVVQGASVPYDGIHSFSDGAYGEDGVAGIRFELSPQRPRQINIHEWYAQKLDQNPGTIILCTGPATNIARFIEKYPQKAAQIREFIFMGGAIDPPGKDGRPVLAENGQKRTGNITAFAEFNAYQDPHALNIILQSGLKTTIVAADATQHIIFTSDRQERIRQISETYGPAFHRMMTVVEPLDRAAFGVEGAFIHDPTAAAYLIAPELFTSRTIEDLYFDESAPRPLQTTRRGEALVSSNRKTKATWLNGVTDPEAVFGVIEDGIRRTAAQAAENRARLVK